MGLFDSPTTPTPPNPIQTAAAQTGTNVSTAIANSYLGNVNQSTPQGTLRNDVTDTYAFTDPTTGQSFNIPRWTATQTLNPVAQQTFNQNQAAQSNMSGMAQDQSASLRNLLGSAFNPQAPAMGDINLLNQVGAPQSTIGDTNQFQTSYGPTDNFSADRQRVEQSMFERVNPQIQQQEDRLRQQLADQGIRYGQGAYNAAYDPFNRQVTDTRLGIVAAGGQEQQRMNEMARAQASFYNQAAQSQFDQAAARGQFYNTAQNQLLGQQSARFNAANQLRNQSLQEQYQLRGQPINEITALLSGSQVSQPNFINASRSTIPTTDVAGLINQNFAQQNDIFKTQTGSWNDLIGGTLGAAGNIGRGIATSDARVKENIVPMGSIMSPRGKELPIYAYDFKGDFDDGQRHVGPMAQDVEKIDPKAVKTIGGIKHIDRDKLGSIFGSS